MPKTATKTLQWRIFSQHSEIFYLGRFDGKQFQMKYRQYEACRDETVFRIMDEVAYRGFRDPNIQDCKELLAQYLAEHNPENKVPVWSWESYATDSQQNRKSRAESLRLLFGEAKIVITIRHPIKLLESAFLQQLKRDNIGAKYQRGKAAFYCSIDQWVARDFMDDISNHLDYPETVRMYVEQFGRENVCVLVFEDLLRDKVGFYNQLCKFMGIDPAEALRLVDVNVDNSRWTSAQLERLRSIKKSPLASLRFRFSNRKGRKKMLALTSHGSSLSTGDAAREEIAPLLREQVLARTCAGNEWLDQTFDLGLKEYGYY
jgi:hypothetical protein